jgi:hypothetical protein
MDQHWICLDGCESQVKNSFLFQWLCTLHKNSRYHIFEAISILGLGQGSMMEQVHESKQNYTGEK